MAFRRSFLACGCLAEACWSVIPQSRGFFSWLAGCFSWLALMGSLCLIFLCIVLVWLLQFLAGALRMARESSHSEQRGNGHHGLPS